jgi:hypothetical protein
VRGDEWPDHDAIPELDDFDSLPPSPESAPPYMRMRSTRKS